MTTPSSQASPWLYGPRRDLLLGCGGGYLCVLVALMWVGPDVRTLLPLSLLAFVFSLVGAPHYGATLLRVYEQRRDRRAYALFAVHVTVFLALAFVLGTRVRWIGSLMLTIYLSWNPWHYAGQNYGLAVMLLRRRGIAIDSNLKRWIYASFVLSFVIAFLVMHRAESSASFAPLDYGVSDYGFLRLGIPAPIADVIIPLAIGAYVISLGIAGVGLLRRASFGAIAPAVLLVVTQAFWFAIPIGARYFGVFQGVDAFRGGNLIYYFFWAAFAHAVQYLWVTSYYYRRDHADFGGYGRYFLQALLAGTALWIVPGLLFAPELLGKVPYDAGLATLVAATVNLHHFVLDGAIWKLRDGRIAQVLIRTEESAVAADDGADADATGRHWLRPVIWGAGAVSVAVMCVGFVEAGSAGRAMNRGDPRHVEASLGRLRWIGRDSPHTRTRLAQVLDAQGDSQGALEQYRESIALYATPAAWRLMAAIHERQGDRPAALAAYAELSKIAPTRPRPYYRTGLLWLEQGDVQRATHAMEEAVRLAPDNVEYRAELERVRAAASDP